MEKCYKDFMRYGEILFCEDFDYTKWGGDIMTIKIASLNGIRIMFVCTNGKVEKMEYLGVE